MEEQQKAYYAIIPAEVRYDEELPPNAKLLYGEITSLCNEKGYCWATNQYFADLYHVKVWSISNWIKLLSQKNYIHLEIIYKEGSNQIIQRRLYINPILKNHNTYCEKSQEGILKNHNTPNVKNHKDNNKDINNTFNNKKDVYTRKNKFGEYHHVLLTEDEYERLKDLYGGYKQVEEHIKILDEYIETSGKNYKNHSLVLQKWVHDEWTKRNKNNPVKLDSKFYVEESNQSYEDVHKEMERVRREILGA